MAKRDRELRHRLEELFSSEAEAPPADTSPIEPAGSTPDSPPVDASPIESVARTLDALPPAMWKTILDLLPHPVYIKDREHTWIALNSACSDLLGRPVGMLLGHTDKEQSDEAWQLDDAVLESGQPDDTQITTTALDGSLHTRRTRRIPITDEQGQVRYVLGLVEDSVKPAAEPIASGSPVDGGALARFQSIVEATPIPILITRVTDGRPLYVNARASVMFGVPREEILNHTTLEFYNDAVDRQRILAALQRDGRVNNFEVRLKRPDGTLIWVTLDVQPLVYNNERAVLSGFYDITERKQAEERVRNSEILYQSLVEAIPENLCRKDKQGRFTYGNHHYCELVGMRLEELRGKTDYDIHPPDLAEKYRADDQAVMAGGQVVEFDEAHVVLGTGELNYVHTIKTPLYDSAGQVSGVQIMFWDVTEQVRARQELQLRTSALEAAANGVTITDRDGKIIWVNPAFSELTGYAFEEAIGQHTRLLNSGRQSKEFYREMWQTILSGHNWHGELINRRKDGREYDEEITITPLRASSGEITHFIAIMQDIRERKRNEQQILRFKLGMERSGDAIFITDLDGKIEYVNPAFEEIYGYTEAEALGNTPRILKSGVIPAEQYQNFWQTLKAKGTIAGELINKTKDGRLITIEGANTPIIDEEGNLVGFLAVHRDVTARRETEHRLAEAAQRLQLLIENVPDLIYIKDRTSKFVIANQPVADSLGAASPADLIGKSDFDFHPPELAEQFYTEEQALLDSGRPLLNLEEQVLGPDGNPIWLETTKVPFRDANGQISGLVGVARNTTASKENARRLAEIAQRLQLLIENVPDLIYIKDRAGKFLVANRPVAILAGASSADVLLGKTDFDFFPREFAEKYAADEQTILRTGQPLMNLEEKSVGPDGGPRWLSTTKVPFRNADGDINGIIGIGRDITERKQIEAERERLFLTEARRAVQLQTGSEIANAAATILDPEKLLPVVVELIRERYDLYYAGLFLVDASGHWAELRSGTGEAGRKMMEARHRLEIGGASMIGRCIAGGEARIALDVGAEAVRFSNPLLPRTRSEMALPLTSRGQIIGALTIQSTQLAAFTPDDISALRTMAGQIATTIENARLFQETQRRAEEQATLFSTAQALSTQLSIDEVLQTVYKSTARLLDASNFYIGLYDPARHQVDFVINASESVVDLNITSIPADQGMTGYIIRTRSNLLIKDHVDEWLAAHDLQRIGTAAKSWLGVPLVLGDQMLGVMSVQSYTTPGQYTEHDRDLLALLGIQVAIAIQNAQLFEQTRAARATAESRLRESQILQEFSQAVSQALDVPQVLDALLTTLEHQLAFSHIAIALIEPEAEQLSIVRAMGTAAGLLGLRRPLAEIQDDITLDILRRGRIEVIDGWDDRLNRVIFERERHVDLVRAFVPIRLRDESIGLIEAGYQRSERAHITPEEVRVMGGLADQTAIAYDNARLLEQVQTALGETERLYNASQQLSVAPDVPGMLTALVQHTPVTDINRLVVWLFEFDAERQVTAVVTSATWHSGVGEPPPPIGTRLPPNALRAFQFARSRQPVVTSDTENDDRIDPTTRAALRQLHVRAVAVFPLWTGDRQVGLLMLQSEQPHVFVDAEIRPYVSLVQQMAAAIENRQLFEEARARAEELSIINDIGQKLTSALNLEDLYRVVHQQVSRLFDTTNFIISTYEPGSEYLYFAYVIDNGQPRETGPISLGGFSRHVIKTGQALVLNSSDEFAKFRDLVPPTVYHNQLAKAWLGVPLIAANQVVGAIILQDYFRENVYSPRQVALLSTISNQIAVGIQNARLFDQTQRDAERERTINRITSRLRNAQSVEQVLSIAAQELRVATRSAMTTAEIEPRPPANGPVSVSENGGAKSAERGARSEA